MSIQMSAISCAPVVEGYAALSHRSCAWGDIDQSTWSFGRLKTKLA